jgi:hypothetical protein
MPVARDLPSDVLRYIFLFLHTSDVIKCRAVCRHWYLAIMHCPESFAALRLNGRVRRQDEEAVVCFALAHCHAIRELTLPITDVGSFAESTRQKLVAAATRGALRKLGISERNICSDAGRNTMLSILRHSGVSIRHVVLHGLSADFLLPALKLLPRIQLLHCTNCEMHDVLCKEWITAMFVNHPCYIHTLELDINLHISDRSMELLFTHCLQLTHLTVSGCHRLEGTWTKIPKRLQHLSYSFMKSPFTTANWTWQACSHLSTLHLATVNYSHGMNEQLYDALRHQSATLQSFSLSTTYDDDRLPPLETLFLPYPLTALRVLTLSRNRHLRRVSLTPLPDCDPTSPAFPSLSFFAALMTPLEEACISDLLGQQMPNVRSAELDGGGSELSDAFVTDLWKVTARSPIPRMQALQIVGGTMSSLSLPIRCSSWQLRRLKLQGCHYLRDLDLSHLHTLLTLAVESCLHLHSCTVPTKALSQVTLAHCDRLGKFTLATIHAPLLQQLAFHYIPSSAYARLLPTLPRKCPRLTHLQVTTHAAQLPPELQEAVRSLQAARLEGAHRLRVQIGTNNHYECH